MEGGGHPRVDGPHCFLLPFHCARTPSCFPRYGVWETKLRVSSRLSFQRWQNPGLPSIHPLQYPNCRTLGVYDHSEKSFCRLRILHRLAVRCIPRSGSRSRVRMHALAGRLSGVALEHPHRKPGANEGQRRLSTISSLCSLLASVVWKLWRASSLIFGSNSAEPATFGSFHRFALPALASRCEANMPSRSHALVFQTCHRQSSHPYRNLANEVRQHTFPAWTGHHQASQGKKRAQLPRSARRVRSNRSIIIHDT